MRDKKEIRKRMLKIRDGLAKKTVERKSSKITEKIFLLKELQRAQSIMFYSAFRNEVDTREMIEKSLELKKKVFLPKIAGSEIVPVQIKNLKNLVSGQFGISEPKLKNSRTIDIVVVPGIAFDKNRNRIGFGKGYFDRFLKKQKTAVKIAPAYEFQIVKKVPVSKSDVPMDFVVTEKRIFKQTN